MAMELTAKGLADTEAFVDAGVALPGFEVERLQAAAHSDPRWIHIGPGNIFRVFIARLAQELIESGQHWPITAVVPMDPRELDVQLAAHDLLTLGVTLNPDGSQDLKVIAGIGEGLATARAEDFNRLVDIIKDPKVTLMSFTITEKGYGIRDSAGAILGSVEAEIETDPLAHHRHTMLLVAGLLLHRFNAGGAPITLLSCDNFSHNGDVLRAAVLAVAHLWADRGLVSEEYVAWLSDPRSVAFPISVIDKITPRPNAEISAKLADLGFTDMAIKTPYGPPLAGFVNTEPTEYLIIEDNFAAPIPPLTEVGVIITDRKTCDDFERMKVTTCLNPLHTALAMAGCLLRFPTIDSEMRDPALRRLAERLGWDEGMPVVVDPGIVSPADFLHEVLDTRFPNPYLPDEPARIAADTSQKLPIRFGETIKSYLQRGLPLQDLRVIPLVFALWCRYLLAVADDGRPFTPSPDPLLDELSAHLAQVRLGEPADVHAALAPILSNPSIFGIDLYTTLLAAQTEAYFTQLIAGPGAVRSTLDKEMNDR